MFILTPSLFKSKSLNIFAKETVAGRKNLFNVINHIISRTSFIWTMMSHHFINFLPNAIKFVFHTIKALNLDTNNLDCDRLSRFMANREKKENVNDIVLNKYYCIWIAAAAVKWGLSSKWHQIFPMYTNFQTLHLLICKLFQNITQS